MINATGVCQWRRQNAKTITQIKRILLERAVIQYASHFKMDASLQGTKLHPMGTNYSSYEQTLMVYTTARVFVVRIRFSCAFPTHCTCVEFKLRMKRESTYFETHEYSLAAL